MKVRNVLDLNLSYGDTNICSFFQKLLKKDKKRYNIRLYNKKLKDGNYNNLSTGCDIIIF